MEYNLLTGNYSVEISSNVKDTLASVRFPPESFILADIPPVKFLMDVKLGVNTQSNLKRTQLLKTEVLLLPF